MLYNLLSFFLILFISIFKIEFVFCQAVAAGYDFSVVVCNDNKPRSAGTNGAIELGFPNPPTIQIFTPVAAPAAGMLSSVTSIEAGYQHCLALKSDATAWAFGYNNNGQMGDGSVINRDVAVKVRDPSAAGYLSNIIKVSGGYWHSLALDGAGNVFAWGYGGNGEMGNNTTTASNPICFKVKDPPGTGYLSGIVDIAAGYNHNVAVKNDGTVWTWGSDANGQLGDDAALAGKLLPVQVSGLTNIIKCAAGQSFSLFLKNDGTVWSCGLNTSKQLGDGTTIQRPTPVQTLLNSSGVGITGITDIWAGEAHAFALNGTTGVLYAWGKNSANQLGDGTGTNQWKAVTVIGLTGTPVNAALGANHSIVVHSNGTNQDWGDNSWGQMGNGNNTFLAGAKTSFGAGGGNCTLMPVELLEFTGKSKYDNINLKWRTASEINNDYFEVERSVDGKTWSEAGKVLGAGNSTTEKQYDFSEPIDEMIFSSPLIYYRLKQVDYDGRSEFFGPIAVRIINEDEWILLLQSALTENELLCTLFSPEDGKIVTEIYDMNGKAIIRKAIQVTKGSNLLQFNVDVFSTGVYFIKVISAKGNHTEKKFVKDSR